MLNDIVKRYDLGALLAKLGGIGGSFVASHLVALTTTPQYAAWWGKFYLTAPQITDIPAFEKMVGTSFALIWITGEHYWQRMTTTPKEHQRAEDSAKGDETK